MVFMQMHLGKCIRQMENGFYALNVAKCGIYFRRQILHNGFYAAAFWSRFDFSISECKYKGKMQMQRQMHRKMVFMP